MQFSRQRMLLAFLLLGSVAFYVGRLTVLHGTEPRLEAHRHHKLHADVEQSLFAGEEHAEQSSQHVDAVMSVERKVAQTDPVLPGVVAFPAAQKEKDVEVPAQVAHRSVNANGNANPQSVVKAPPKEEEGVKAAPSKAGNAMPERQAFVKKMIKHAWDSYEKYAWGYNELLSVGKTGSDSQGMFGNGHLGASLVDALDTLYIAGFDKEYQRGRDWVAKEFTFDKAAGEVSMFEMNIRFMGAFLTMYAFTGDDLYKKQAIDLGERFAKGFHLSTGLSHNAIRLNGFDANSDYSGPCFVIAEPGSLHLEFAYLSKISGDDKYLQIAQRVRSALNTPQMTGLPGLPYSEINTNTGSPCRTDINLDGGSDSYYEYVMKSFIQSGKKDTRAQRLFNTISNTVRTKLMTTVFSGDKPYRVLGRTYGGGGGVDPHLGHLGCFTGGMFALGASFTDTPVETLQVGKDITQACREMYDRTATKLGPDDVMFNSQKGGDLFSMSSSVYLLRPEVVESYFVLWRVTKDPKYREWGWEAAKAMEKHCRNDGGYTDIQNVNVNPPSPNSGVQQSFFLAETLKYLYLLFSDDDVLPLDKWVFNTEAHPFPVDGAFDRVAGVPFRA